VVQKFLKKAFFLSAFSIAMLDTSAADERIATIQGVEISNLIVECVQLELINKLNRNNVILLDVELLNLKSVGYCGCKSPILSYYVEKI